MAFVNRTSYLSHPYTEHPLGDSVSQPRLPPQTWLLLRVELKTFHSSSGHPSLCRPTSFRPKGCHRKRLRILPSPSLHPPTPTLPESGSRGDFGVHRNPSSSTGGPEDIGGDPLTPSSAMRAPSRPSRGGGGPRGESKRQQGDGTCGVAPPSWGERWFLGCARLRRRPRWRRQNFQWNVSEVLFEYSSIRKALMARRRRWEQVFR